MSIPERVPFIFVADDEPVIADALASMLNNSGYEAVAFYSGEQLVEAATLIKPDLLISDVVMPGVNGIEAALRIRESLPETRVLLLSGREIASHSLGDRAEEHQFTVLDKPIQPQILLDRLREIFGAKAA